jgi:protein-disulfide isomerase
MWLFGAIFAVVAIALFALLFLNLQSESTPEELLSLTDYCRENPERCATEGSPDASVTLLEVSDYGCGACQSFNLETAGLLRDLYVTPGQIRWVFLPFALGSATAPAAEASMCADDQERFLEFHNRMFEIQGTAKALTTDGFLEAAGDLGMDVDVFESCLKNGDYRSIIQLNIEAAQDAGVGSTPTFFINDRPLVGAHPLSSFQQEINPLLENLNEG